MKAKLYEVTQGKFHELVIGISINDAMESVKTSAMGLRKACLVGRVELVANQQNGVTSYKLLNDKFLPNFGENATISGELYNRLPEN